MLQAQPTIDWQDRRQALGGVLARALELLPAAVELLVLTGAAGEQDQTFAVGLEACDVEGEGFLRVVLPTVVDGDADGGGESAGDAGFLLYTTLVNSES